MSTVTPEQLADTFSAVLHRWLTPEAIAEINRLNAESADAAICHSHDFCDANQAMIDALAEHQIEWSTDCNDLVDAAWDIAKANEFRTTPVKETL